jgi:hypothetical protein
MDVKLVQNTMLTKNKTQAAEMKFLLKVKGCTRLDKNRNEDIRKDLQKLPLNDRFLEYTHK